MRVVVNEDLCTGHGRCYTLAPVVFGCDDDGYVDLLVDGELPEGAVAGARIAVQNCPEGALQLVD